MSHSANVVHRTTHGVTVNADDDGTHTVNYTSEYDSIKMGYIGKIDAIACAALIDRAVEIATCGQ